VAKGGRTPEARLAAAEHQRQVVLLRIRGITFDAIGKQLGMTRQAAHLLYKRALKLTPKADVEEMRKLEAERCLQRYKTEPVYRRQNEPPLAGCFLSLF
jgi:hypothetical protein